MEQSPQPDPVVPPQPASDATKEADGSGERAPSIEKAGAPAPPNLVEPKHPKRALSAYFYFLADHREGVKEKNPEFSIGQVGKELGRMWAELDDAGKAKYKKMNEEAKIAYNASMVSFKAAMEEFKAAGGVTAADKDISDGQAGPTLPLSRIKSIMKKDPDVKNMSKEALWLTTMSVEEFIRRLGKAASQHMTQQKRKAMRYEDVAAAVRSSSSFRFLEVDFPPHEVHNAKKRKLNPSEKHAGSGVGSVKSGPMDSFFGGSKKVVEAAKEAESAP